MSSFSVLETLNQELERLTGCEIGVKYIQSDKKGWLKYIPPGSLYRGMPLILSHYVGALFVVLPHQDYHDLIRGKVSVAKYIDESVWNYGYFLGAANLKTGIYWQTLENGNPGIRDTAKVKRFLTIMQCRTAQKHLGEEAFDKKRCLGCDEYYCPASPMDQKRLSVTWEEEFPELAKPKRLEFYEAISKLVKERFGMKVCALQIDKSLDKSRENIYLVTGFLKNTVKVILSQELFMDMLYFPENFDVPNMIQTYGLFAATQRPDSKTKKIFCDITMKIKRTTTSDDLKKFWYGV